MEAMDTVVDSIDFVGFVDPVEPIVASTVHLVVIPKLVDSPA